MSASGPPLPLSVCIQTVGLAQFRYRQQLRAALLRVWAHVPGSADWFVGDAAMDAYACAFTTESANPDANYEFFEILGDASLNKSVTWYFQDRFPQLRCAGGVRYLARLKINTIAKDQLARWTCALGLAPLIRWGGIVPAPPLAPATTANFNTQQMSVLEDVFEAMLGVTELRVDALAGTRGPGYSAVYSLIARLLDPAHFDLTYEALWDPKTRLKELFDAQGGWRLVYDVVEDRDRERGGGYAVDVRACPANPVRGRAVCGGPVQRCLLGSSPAGKTFGRRIEAEQAAAECALAYLRGPAGARLLRPLSRENK